MGGGHAIGQFYGTVKKNNYTILTDLDVTDNLSPNLKLLNDLLVNRFIPFSNTLDAFLTSRANLFYRFLKYMFRKKLEKMKYKYSHSRNEENFRKFQNLSIVCFKRTLTNHSSNRLQPLLNSSVNVTLEHLRAI